VQVGSGSGGGQGVEVDSEGAGEVSDGVVDVGGGGGGAVVVVVEVGGAGSLEMGGGVVEGGGGTGADSVVDIGSGGELDTCAGDNRAAADAAGDVVGVADETTEAHDVAEVLGAAAGEPIGGEGVTSSETSEAAPLEGMPAAADGVNGVGGADEVEGDAFESAPVGGVQTRDGVVPANGVRSHDGPPVNRSVQVSAHAMAAQ
jgi:hypothetical protein